MNTELPKLLELSEHAYELPMYEVSEDGTVHFLTPEQLHEKDIFTRQPDGPAITPTEIARLEERDTLTGTPGKSYKVLRCFHWLGAPEPTNIMLESPSPKFDILCVHNDRVQRDPVGEFAGSPIFTLDDLGIEVDKARDLNTRLAVSKGTSVPAEVLPGEERCADGIIRRTTTAEAQGYDNYHNQEQIETNQRRVSIAEGRKAAKDGAMIYFRPNSRVGEGEYALIEVS